MKHHFRTAAMIGAITVFASGLPAVDGHGEAKRGHGAHEHGVGKLNIAVEGGEIEMELEAPGADIVGFEHAAEHAEDRAKVEAAIAVLERPLGLFRFPDAATCTVTSASAELHGDAHEEKDKDKDEHGHGHAKKDDHGHGKDDKDHGHGHAKKDDHGHGHDKHAHDKHEDEEEGGPHNEFHAEYRISCAKPAAIDRIVLDYFTAFPNARELEIQMISDKGSSGFEVSREDPVLNLEGKI